MYEGACKDDKEMFNWKYGTEEIYNDIKKYFPNATKEKVESISYQVYNKYFSKSNLRDIHNKSVVGLYKDFVGSILSVLKKGEIKEESLVYARNELYTALEQLGLNYTKQEVEKVAKVVYHYFNKNTKINLTLDDIYNKDKNYWLDFVGSVATVLKK
ncbi:hypothetical protein [Candidatus Vampirococcus lugosii]|uniref:TipAS antibiotic-recognition domain-containing protein n=1 Tax=Candidatus Vampirococcus lugosii TaxID=2789015 RepID=A0ABS5QMU7_9BACT|nr:hypothetical protein [Candidatus Vampirococcus lugosii]MBS8122522.1 hypothetical protein [Candidatus Vampirococcus lugosii]